MKVIYNKHKTNKENKFNSLVIKQEIKQLDFLEKDDFLEIIGMSSYFLNILENIPFSLDLEGIEETDREHSNRKHNIYVGDFYEIQDNGNYLVSVDNKGTLYLEKKCMLGSNTKSLLGLLNRLLKVNGVYLVDDYHWLGKTIFKDLLEEENTYQERVKNSLKYAIHYCKKQID